MVSSCICWVWGFILKVFHEGCSFNRYLYLQNPLKESQGEFTSLSKVRARNLAVTYLLQVNNRNPWKRCEICSKLTIKTPERHQLHHSGVFIVNFEHTSYLFLVFLYLTLNMQLPAWKNCFKKVDVKKKAMTVTLYI